MSSSSLYISQIGSQPRGIAQNSKNISIGATTGLASALVTSDPFRINSSGKIFSTIFYVGFFIGLICVISAVVITIIPGSSQEDVQKLELIQANTKWLYDQKQSLMESTDLKITISREISSDSQAKTSIPFSIDTPNTFKVLTDSKNTGVSSQFSNLLGTHFQIDLDLPEKFFSLKNSINIKQNNKQLCLQMTSDNQVLKVPFGFATCESNPNSLAINLTDNLTLSFEEMRKMNMCGETNENCEKTCELHKGVPHRKIFEKQSSETHSSLAKHVTVARDTCTAEYALKELCLISQFDNDSKQISAITGGCFNQSRATIYDFAEESVSSPKITVRDQEDPYLKAIENQGNYEPNIEVKDTMKDKVAKALYLTGSLIFFMLIVLITLLRIKTDREQEFTPITKITTLTPQSA